MEQQTPPEYLEDRIKHWELTLSDAQHAVHVALGQLALLYPQRYSTSDAAEKADAQ